MPWINESGWYIDAPSSEIYRDDLLDENSLLSSGPELIFRSDKDYVFRLKVDGLANFGAATEYISTSTDWGDSMFFSVDDGFDISEYAGLWPLATNPDGYLYLYSKPPSDISTTDYCRHTATSSFIDPSGYNILRSDIFQIDWGVNGYSWIGDAVQNQSSTQKPNRSSGWFYGGSDNSYYWYDDKAPAFNLTQSIFNGKLTSDNDLNYLYKFIDFQIFNIEFTFTKFALPNNDINAGVNFYISDVIFIGNTIVEFQNFINNCFLLKSVTQNETFLSYGLKGNKYLYIVADTPDSPLLTHIKISDLKIEGGYHEANNQIFSASPINISFNDVVLNDASFIISYGSGNSDDGNVITSEVTSKIGNGRFEAGIWENGVWNSGWREDESVKEFNEIIKSIKVFSDIRWRINISGRKELVDEFNIGDSVSIGNIISIDINNKRRLLKDSYRIINIGTIDDNLSFIEVEIETQFPVRRIEKDSNLHRIRVTKNIWLSGAFLNGYFSGVWNNGLFKGYPLITEMYNTNWIDGRFDGGHFNSEKHISGSFSQTFRYDDILPSKLGLSFSSKHNLQVGDSVDISKSNISVNSSYDGETSVIKIIDEHRIVVEKQYGSPQSNEDGSVFTEIRNGIIQNMSFDSKNISPITSVDSTISSDVFIYNSWIDTIYDDDSAVNIGKPQNILDGVSKRTYSENNLYGYPTNDVLSSKSKFRDSYSLNNRIYNLGNKYEIFSDYIGDSSNFTEYFGVNSSDFLDLGWTYSKSSAFSITFSRTNNYGQYPILGQELRVEAELGGGVLDISDPTIEVNRNLDNISKSRYSIIEFDLVKSDIIDSYFSDIVISPGFGYIEETAFPPFDPFVYVKTNKYYLRNEPLIHFNNLNYTKREFADIGTFSTGLYDVISTHLPVYQNIHHVLTPKTKKVEYFFNKRNLSMVFRGNGYYGENQSSFVINNLKLYEVDMIPFFKYFNGTNINTSVQVPLQGTSPYINFVKNDYIFVDKSNIGFDSINIVVTNEVLNEVGKNLIGD